MLKVGLIALVPILLLVFGLATGNAQSLVLRAAVALVLDARLELEGVRGVSPLRVAHVRLFDGDDPAGAAPVLDARNLRVALDFSPLAIAAVTADSATLNVRAADTNDTNLDFLRDLLAERGQPAEKGGLLPHELRIPDLSLIAEIPERTLAMSKLSVTMTSEGDTQFFCVTLMGEQLEARVTGMPGYGELKLEQAALDVRLQRRDDNIMISPLRADLPGIAHVTAAVGVDGNGYRVTVTEMAVDGGPLGSLGPPLLPVPVAFERLAVRDAAVVAPMKSPLLFSPESRMDASAEGLVVGPAEAPYYAGALHVRGGPTDEGFEAVATLDLGQELRVVTNGGIGLDSATVTFKGWTRDQLVQSIPPRYRDRLDIVDGLRSLQTVDGQAVAERGANAWQLDAHLHAAFAEDTLAVSYSGELLCSEHLLAGNLGIDGAALAGSIAIYRDGEAAAELVLDSFRPGRTAGVVGVTFWPESLQAELSGPLVLSTTDGAATFEWDLQAHELSLGEMKLAHAGTVPLTGTASWSAESNAVTGTRFRAQGPGNSDISLTGWAYNISEKRLTGGISGNIDAGALAAAREIDGIGGDVAIKGALRYEEGKANVDAAFESYDVYYQDYRVPGGSLLSGETAVIYSTEDGNVTVGELTLALDGATTVDVTETAVTLAPLAFEAPFTFTSDLAPVADITGIDFTGAHATGSGKLLYGQAVGLDLAIDATAATVNAPDDLAVLTGMSLTGNLSYVDGAITGAGRAGAANVVAYGAAVETVLGPWRIEDDALVLESVRGEVYEGAVELEGQIALFEEGRPARFVGHLRNVNLADFTERYEPPGGARLTGRASGGALIAWDGAGLQEFRTQLSSREEFSLNRDLVKQILLSDQIRGVLGEKRVDRVMDQVLGQGDQRPFDAGSLRLQWTGADYEGIVALNSEALNLTIDLNIEPEALTQALELKQNARIESLEDLRMDPLELKNN